MREIKEQFEGSVEEYGKTYKFLDVTKFYTEQAKRILNSKHADIYNHEVGHDAVIKKINDKFLFYQGTKNTEKELEAEFSRILGGQEMTEEEKRKHLYDLLPEGLGERVLQKYMYADEYAYTGKKIFNSVKYPREDEPDLSAALDEDNNLDFDHLGAELSENFILRTFYDEFTTEKRFERFVTAYADNNTWEELESILEDYMESQGNLTGLNSWGVYTLASIMLWKSNTKDQLFRSIDALHAMETAIKDEFVGFKERYMMVEFQDGADRYIDDYLWLRTCEIASACLKDISDTLHEICDNATNQDPNIEEVFIHEFMETILLYLNPPHAGDGNEAREKLKTHYMILCQKSDDEGIGDFDDQDD